jgi:hypothetical protein
VCNFKNEGKDKTCQEQAVGLEKDKIKLQEEEPKPRGSSDDLA